MWISKTGSNTSAQHALGQWASGPQPRATNRYRAAKLQNVYWWWVPWVVIPLAFWACD